MLHLFLAFIWKEDNGINHPSENEEKLVLPGVVISVNEGRRKEEIEILVDMWPQWD